MTRSVFVLGAVFLVVLSGKQAYGHGRFQHMRDITLGVKQHEEVYGSRMTSSTSFPKKLGGHAHHGPLGSIGPPSPSPSPGPTPSPSPSLKLPFVDVTDYGAKGDNITDNTAAFTAAITEAAGADDGTYVYVPGGMYRFHGSITIPAAVTLQGSYGSVPSHDVRNKQLPVDGTILMPMANRGNDTATPFITVMTDGAVRGLVVYYPEQEIINTPVPYPYAIALTGPNAAVTDVELLNPWNGISAVGAHRHYIARIQGQPLNIGVFVDATYDIGRIEDVHFNPWFSCQHPFIEYQLVHGRAFVLGRSDWEYIWNTFAFGYAIGYHFVYTSTGTMNGNFLGIGSDLSINASILVDGSQAPGLLITNGEFTAFHTDDWLPNATGASNQVMVSSGNTGPVELVSSSFWGPSDHIAVLSGTGTTSFTSCVFVQWDIQFKNGSAAIEAQSGNVIVNGNDFQTPGTQVLLGKNVSKAVIMGNIIKGPLKIEDQGAKKVQQGLNADDS